MWLIQGAVIGHQVGYAKTLREYLSIKVLTWYVMLLPHIFRESSDIITVESLLCVLDITHAQITASISVVRNTMARRCCGMSDWLHVSNGILVTVSLNSCICILLGYWILLFSWSINTFCIQPMVEVYFILLPTVRYTCVNTRVFTSVYTSVYKRVYTSGLTREFTSLCTT